MAGAASALFLLDIKGRVLVWRDYRGDVTSVQAERFFTKLIEKEVGFALTFELNGEIILYEKLKHLVEDITNVLSFKLDLNLSSGEWKLVQFDLKLCKFS